MAPFSRLASVLRNLVRSGKVDEDLDEEPA